MDEFEEADSMRCSKMLLAFGITVAIASINNASKSLASDISPAASQWTGFYFGAGGGVAMNDTMMNGFGYGLYEVDGWQGETPSWAPYGGQTAYKGDTYASIGVGSGFGNFQSAASNISLLDPKTLARFGETVNDVLSPSDSDAGEVGIVGQTEVGFDYQLGEHVVFGINASYSYGSIESSISASTVTTGYSEENGSLYSGAGGGPAVVQGSLALSHTLAIGGRVGFTPADRFLVFGSAGYMSSLAKLEGRFAGNGDAGDRFGDEDDTYAAAEWNMATSNSYWLSGFYVGGGFEGLLTEHFSLKVEYRYANLGTITSTKEYAAGDTNAGDYWKASVGMSAEADVNVHTVFATANFRF